MKGAPEPNHLIHEKSPYLLQHAYNPVGWFPWGEAAFAKARQENRPIFLSVGYSTCHWCHVMERESFEDEEVARLLNAFYVPVKVDREERPDVDHIYMQAAQAMTGRGGWPLTVIMDPEGKPFFGATYLPKTDRMGMTGLITLLDKVATLWQQSPAELTAAGRRLVEILDRTSALAPGEIPENILTEALEAYRTRFDPDYGGFGPAPKFPTPHHLFFLLRCYDALGDAQALEMVTTTLDAMAAGGIYDHIGFGFSRYATDDAWIIPHFEKMLYDNALLLIAYLEGYQATGRKSYRQIAEEILTYVSRDMTSAEGAFYSAEDADTQGEEGLFYTWTPAEITAVLGSADGERFCQRYGITAAGHLSGRSIPHLTGQSADPIESSTVTAMLDQLREHRSDRPRPFKDDKILTGWNGLMMVALARAARILNRSDLAEQARRAWTFIHQQLITCEGRLLARYRDGEAAFPAYLDDYAYLTWGLLELFETTGDPELLEAALTLTEDMLELFASPSGALYFYGHDQEALIVRPIHLWDGALPSGNGIALNNLIRLSRITGRSDWDSLIQQMFQAFGPNLAQQPLGHASALTAWLATSSPGAEVVVVKPKPDTPEPFLRHLHSQYRPQTTAFAITEHDPRWQNLSPFLASLTSRDQQPTAYVCQNHTCSRPVTSETDFLKQLD